MPTLFKAQNGAVITQNMNITVAACVKAQAVREVI
jgi:hypothetical protein